MVIDFHTHIVPPRMKEDRGLCLGKDPFFHVLYAPRSRLATAEELIASMDQAGVDVSVILNMGWTSHELCVETNDYILEAIARYPRRLVGLGSLLPQAGDKALRELERLVKGGIRGLGELRPEVQGFGPRDLEPLAPVLQKHRLLLMFHASEPVGHPYPGKGKSTPDLLYPFLTACPEITFVLAHWGGGLPFFALMPEVAQALKNTWFDTAATRFLYRPAIYQHAGQIAGWDKILFGTDFPLLSQKKCLEEVRSLDLEEEKKAQILGANAQKLLGLA